MALTITCPVCGKPLTLGVLHRVEDLADCREEPRVPFRYQIPLLGMQAVLLAAATAPLMGACMDRIVGDRQRQTML